jgi:3-hydroxymyristoyl/3-hydroxydecanoyl-(acyl carrier protein) dehydratase
VPGDVLTLELLMAKRKLAYWKMAGRILVGDEVAMEAEISAAETKN